MLHRTFLLYLTVFGMMMISTSQARGFANLLRINLEQRASLATRQTAQCQSICNPVYATASTGCSPSSCCNESFEHSYFNCFLCVAGALGLTDYTEPQTVLDGLVNECALTGNNLPKLTFPGQHPNRTLSSNLSSSTASRFELFIVARTISQATVSPAPSTSAWYSTHSRSARSSTYSRSARSSTHSRSARSSTHSRSVRSSTYSTSATSSTYSTSATSSTLYTSATPSTLHTSATSSTLSTSATPSRPASLGVRSAQSCMLGFVVTMMMLVEFFYSRYL